MKITEIDWTTDSIGCTTSNEGLLLKTFTLYSWLSVFEFSVFQRKIEVMIKLPFRNARYFTFKLHDCEVQSE